MSVDIGDVVNGGFERTVARSGLAFVGLFYVVGLLNQLLVADIVRSVVESIASSEPDIDPSMATGSLPPSLGLSPGVAGVLLLLLGVLSLVLTAAALRTFISGVTDRVPREFLTRRMGWVLVNLVVGSILFSLAVTVGLVFFVVPGLFLLVALFFWTAFVVDEDISFVDGFERSWNATSGDRLELFALGVLVVIAGFVVNMVVGIPAALLPSSASFLLNQLGSAFVNVFTLAATAEAYTQLTAGPDDPEPETDEFATGSAPGSL